MKIDINVKMSFDLSKVNLDLHRELNTAGQIIKKDHYQRLEKGKDIYGSAMTRLKDATIKRKGSNKILVDTGQMRNLVIEKATKSNQTVEVHPGRIRKYKGTKVTMADVGGFHQRGYRPNNLPKREWFGITLDAESRILQSIEDKIERQLIRA